jgi:hypothetical protein
MEVICTLHGLLLFRTMHRSTRNKFGEGFEDTLAAYMLKSVENEIDALLRCIDISDAVKILKSD